MATHDAKRLIELLRSGDLPGVKEILRSNPDASRSPKVIVEAARLGSLKSIQLLVKHGADLNASSRNYRPLHSLIQEKPHTEARGAPAERLAVLKWMLEHGADPELLAGWPAARVIITAAFVGEPAYVVELRKAGAVIDGFVAAALGDLPRVEKAIAKDEGFVKARDSGGLTALHCAAGSRMGSRSSKVQASLLAIAKLLLDSGADLNATARSWNHDV